MELLSLICLCSLASLTYSYPFPECVRDSPVYRKLSRCHTNAAFCKTVLTTTPSPTTITEYSSRYKPTVTSHIHYNTTITKTVITATHTITAPVAVLSKGSTTVTIDHCKISSTCGAATFSRRAELENACTCVLQPTLTRTKHIIVRTALAYPHTFTSTTRIIHKKTVYPTSTVSVSTLTVDNCITEPTPDQTCSNSGFGYGIYPIQPAEAGNATDLSGWDPTIYKTRTPDVQDTALALGDIMGSYYGDDTIAYGHPIPNSFEFINHKGYLYASQTGRWRIRIPTVRTKAILWFGDVAYQGWNLSNSLLTVVNAPIYLKQPNNSADGGGHVILHLERGTYYPFRLAYGLGSAIDPYDDYGVFYMEFYQPDGTSVGSLSTSPVYYADSDYSHYASPIVIDSPYFIQFSCDGQAAPQFPAFGHET